MLGRMKFCFVVCFVLLTATQVQAKEKEGFKSGLQPEQRIGAFHVVKHAGNKADGVKVGETLCYRCRLGRRPVVAIFSRKVNKNLVALVKEVDGVVAANEKKQMASFVNLLGDDKTILKKDAKKLIKDSKAKSIAVVVPVENKNGHKQLSLNKDAEVTVLIYKNGIIKANFAYKSGKMDKDAIKSIVKNTSLILN